MNKEELLERLKGYEWTDFEIKLAKNEVPKDTWETVSAFSNTDGGYIIFGVEDKGNGNYEIQGVENVDKLQNDFLTVLRGEKFNVQVSSAGNIIDIDAKDVLAFKLNSMPKHCKPIYYGGDIRNTFIRLGSGDHRCSKEEINRMLRQASELSSDSMVLEGYSYKDIDNETVKIYKRYLELHVPAHPFVVLANKAFLKKMGAIAENNGKEELTMAGLLLFGKEDSIRRRFPAYEVDYYLINLPKDLDDGDRRWDDRKISEKNLIRTFIEFMEIIKGKVEIPFMLASDNITRVDDVPIVKALREMLVNMLIHRDYFERGQANIRVYADRINMFNPGATTIPIDKILEEKATEPRNPTIAKAFRLLGWAESAGSGMSKIFNNCEQIGIEPTIVNDQHSYYFKISIPRQAQKLRQKVSDKFSENELKVINYIKEYKKITTPQSVEKLGFKRDTAIFTFNKLIKNSIIERKGSGKSTYYIMRDNNL